MVFLVFDYVVEDGDGAFVAEVFQLLAIVGDVAAFLDFEATQGHADAAGAVGERIGLSAGIAVVLGLRPAELDDAAMPEGGVLPLGAGQVAQDLGAHRVGVAIGQGLIGVVALHLGLPIGFESAPEPFSSLAHRHAVCCHFCSLRSLEDRRVWAVCLVAARPDSRRVSAFSRSRLVPSLPCIRASSPSQCGVLRIVLCAANCRDFKVRTDGSQPFRPANSPVPTTSKC